MNNYKNWELHKDEEEIVWLGINTRNSEVNTLNEEVLDELNSLLHEISQEPGAKGLVIYSLKAKGFIAGADIHSFSNFKNSEQALDFLQKGQAVFARLESLPLPTVAMIDGFCMGGGFELALACSYRIASDEKHTQIGLPEVKLGLHPGWGGTVRLPRLIGGFKALSEVILPGSFLGAEKAKALGMIDEVVPIRQLKRAVIYAIKNKSPLHKPSIMEALSNKKWLRKPLASLLRRNLVKRVREDHYPAPYAMVDLWEKEGGNGDRAYLKEIDSVEQLVSHSDTAKNLIRAFSLRERLKGYAKEGKWKAAKVHVIGAGTMGGDIAAWCALQGLSVTLQDQSYAQIAPAFGRAHALYKKKCRKPHLIQAAMDRLSPDPHGYGVAEADVIIEAVFENLALKQEVMAKIEKFASPKALLATNTSSIPLDEIASIMDNPERLVGIHFFNPVAQMDLVEVVSSASTAKKVQQDACSFVGQIGKLPLPVLSSPGFLVNRLLMPYLMESIHLLEEGYTPETVDQAALDFGMLMGPVELADTVGIDVCLAVAKNLSHYFGGSPPKKLSDMVQAGKLGRKTGQGFYKYKHGKPEKEQLTSPVEASLADRLISRMLNESLTCLSEGVVADADLLDAGMIFGTGFAPFRGGPMRYAMSSGFTKS